MSKPYYVQCRTIDIAILRAQKMLEKKVKKKGMYDDFGLKEIFAINDHFIKDDDCSFYMNQCRAKLKKFERWCYIYK